MIRSSSDQPEAMVQLFERFESARWRKKRSSSRVTGALGETAHEVPAACVRADRAGVTALGELLGRDELGDGHRIFIL